jgi:hypothetical protein
MDLYLLTGTPGQSKSKAAEKIATWLRARGLSVGCAQVEDELLKLFPEYAEEETVPRVEPLVNLVGLVPLFRSETIGGRRTRKLLPRLKKATLT